MGDTLSPEVMAYMRTIKVFSCFIKAHLTSQLLLVKYFGGNGKIDEVEEAELARCILQSQVCVYRAIALTVDAKKRTNKECLLELEWAEKMLQVTEGLESFVMKAHEDGAISGRETDSILHPLRGKMSACLKAIGR